MPRDRTLLYPATALIVCLLVGLASAAAPLRIDAAAVTFADGPDETKIGLAWDDCLVLTFGAGDLGIVKIPQDDDDYYQKSVLERVYVPAALTQSGLLEYVGDGVTFVHDCCDLGALKLLYAQRLRALGLEVRVDPARPRQLHASMGDYGYRLVFSYEDGQSVRVFIGS